MTNTKTKNPSQALLTLSYMKAAQAKLDKVYPHTLRRVGEDTPGLEDFFIAAAALDRAIKWAEENGQ